MSWLYEIVGNIYKLKNLYLEAQPYYEKSVEISEYTQRLFPDDYTSAVGLALSYSYIANFYRDTDRPHLAISFYQRAREIIINSTVIS